MAIDRQTSAEILTLQNSEELIGLINLVIGRYPELQHFSASPIAKTKYKTMVQTALPSVAFRADNVGREEQKPVWSTVEVECKFLDASWSIDEKVALDMEWGADTACLFNQQAHMDAALKAIAKQTWYGVSADAGGFVGIGSLLNSLAAPNVINAGGTTANKCTSVFALSTGLQRVSYAWGQDGQFKEGEIMYLPIPDKTTPAKEFWGFRQAITGYVGLQVPSVKCVGRIVNIDDTHPLTDDLLSKLIDSFDDGFEPDMFFAHKKAIGQLRRSRTATNPTGAPAPYPDSTFNMPLYQSSAISNTEAVIA